MKLIRLDHTNLKVYLPQINEIELQSIYPLGDDFFTIDHGTDYFEFFNRLGKYRYYIWQEKNRVLAVACIVLRKVPLVPSGQLRPSWYMCDLKVHTEFRGKRIPLRMLTHILWRNYLKCARGYAVSMNPASGVQNRMARIASNFRWASIQNSSQLLLWSLDEKTMRSIQPIIEDYRGPISYLSLLGIKNIVLSRTQTPLPILHVQFGPLASAGTPNPDPAATHMFCAPQHDALSHKLYSLGIKPSSSATILNHRMPKADWTWLLTSDI